MMKTFPTMLLAVLAVVGWYVEGSTYDAPEGGYNGHLGTLPPGHGKPHNEPVFKNHPGCTSEMRLVDTLLVVDWEGEYHRMSYDEAERRRENKTWADDVWVVGTCK